VEAREEGKEGGRWRCDCGGGGGVPTSDQDPCAREGRGGRLTCRVVRHSAGQHGSNGI
jgi:hypothetical protein